MSSDTVFYFLFDSLNAFSTRAGPRASSLLADIFFSGWGRWAQEGIRVRHLFADIFYSPSFSTINYGGCFEERGVRRASGEIPAATLVCFLKPTRLATQAHVYIFFDHLTLAIAGMCRI